MLSIGSVLFGVSPHFWPVLVGSCLLAAIAGLQAPLVAALTLVVTPRRRLTRRMGRNSAAERAGNVVIAIAIGAIGYLLPDRAVFLLVPALCIVAAAALYAVPPSAGQGEPAPPPPADGPLRLKVLVRSPALIVFALCSCLFHFANAPLLTLVAQDISRTYPNWSSVVISVCIVGAQAVMVPMALVVGHRADRWGRKPLLVAAFLALPARALLYTAWHEPLWLVAVQLIDGVGAGLLSAVKPLVVADLTADSGHYNLALGIVGTMQGIGAALSFVVAGALVQKVGFDAAYLMCGLVALAALALLWRGCRRRARKWSKARGLSFSRKREKGWAAVLFAVVALAATSAAAGDLHATYIDPDDMHLERVLPPPPGSAEARADLAAVAAAVAARTKADEARIIVEKPCTPQAFARGILGPGFGAEAAPLTVVLVEHAFEDTELAVLAVLAAKAAIGRARPYTLDPKLATYGRRSASASYPSGHAACSRVMAIVLAALVPGKPRALFARADIYGRNRVIAGTHFPSDLVAGATAGSVVAAALFGNARFRADFLRAKAEMEAAPH